MRRQVEVLGMIWQNGKEVHDGKAVVSIYDSAMMFGDTAFEMERTFNKNIFKLSEHIDRLLTSIKILGIEIPYTKSDLLFAHDEYLHRMIEIFPEVEEWRFLINVTRGILPIYQEMLEDNGDPTVTIAAFPLRHVLKGKSHLYVEGVKAIIPSQRAIPHHLLDARIKSRSRQHYQVANLDVARQDPEAWALLLDPDGLVAEGTGSNFFIVNQHKEVMTPKPINCLRGISRQYVMSMVRPDRMIEGDITLYDIVTAREAFFTCTPYSILPCTHINGMPIGNGKVGVITYALTQKWSQTVGINFVEQARRWDNE